MAHYGIIGGGIIGTAIGRELASRRLGKVTILEKENSLGRHGSGRNSGVLHSGINQKPGSLKSQMCVKGSRLLREYCRRYHVPMAECGTLVVARNSREMLVLEHLLDMGQHCGVPDLELLSGLELRKKEPRACGVAALLSPTGATVDSAVLLESLSEDARQKGVEYRLGAEVVEFDHQTLVTSQGKFDTDYIINCAGLHADRIAHRMGVGQDYRIIPFRGEYMEVRDCDVRGMIYQPPDLRFPFLSVHLTRETDGRVLAGPTATLAFGREAYEKEWCWDEMREMFLSRPFFRLLVHPEFLRLCLKNGLISFSRLAFLWEINSLVKGVTREQLKPSRAGIRAQLVDARGGFVDDVLVTHAEKATHVLNAVSPGMTCSLAFAEYVVDRILERD